MGRCAVPLRQRSVLFFSKLSLNFVFQAIPALKCHDRAEKLLEFLQRADDRKVDVFLRCLSQCRQNHVRDLIVSQDRGTLGNRRLFY